jgi:hypothetical protein
MRVAMPLKRLLMVAFAAVFAGCGSDVSNSQTIPVDTQVAGVSTSLAPGSSVPARDYGSRFVGQPVAFWFWAPY